MKVGDRIVVVADGRDENGMKNTQPSEDNLIGWKGVITKIWPDQAVCVDLDPEQDPDDLTGLAFEFYEVEVINEAA